MNFIKDTKDLVLKDQLPYDDEKVEKQLAESIQYYVDKDSNSMIAYRKNSMIVYRKKYPDDYFDWEYNYIKLHKKELREKGYKIKFSFSSIVMWPEVGYVIKWKRGK